MSVTGASLNAAGELELALSEEDTRCWQCEGRAGAKQCGVTGASLNAAGELELALSEGGPIAVGNVKGSLATTV